jgi:hypothetical protein
MPDNYQELPGGLIGFRQTPHEVLIHNTASNYNVLNIDQVILMNEVQNVVFDPTILTPGKVFYIKNISGSPIDIIGTIDERTNITLSDKEAITLVYTLWELTQHRFYILARYKTVSPIYDFVVGSGEPMENGDTELTDDRFYLPPTVYIDGLLLTYEIRSDRRYVSFESGLLDKTITINNGGVNEGENIQIFY